MRQAGWLVLLLVSGCPRPLPPPVVKQAPKPKPPPAIRIPPGCEGSLTGNWQHEDDPTFRYRFEDDRTDTTVWVYRVFPPLVVDAGAPPRIRFPGPRPPKADAGVDAGVPDAGPPVDAGPPDPRHRHPLPADLLPADGGFPPLATAVIHLARTPNGFVGEAEMLHLLPSGRECRATFPTQVTACTRSTLTLTSATSTPVGEGCQSPSLPRPAAMLEHRLARTDAGAL